MHVKEYYPLMATTRNESAANCSIIESPIGDLYIVADSSHLIGLYFGGCDHVPNASQAWIQAPHHPVLRQAEAELREYFARARKHFSLPWRFAGTAFQERVWREIADIPFGETLTYSDLAQRTGATQAIRAVGTATGRNPLSLIVPCHRVVGKDGSLRGFAGGLDRKRFLLDLEQVNRG